MKTEILIKSIDVRSGFIFVTYNINEVEYDRSVNFLTVSGKLFSASQLLNYVKSQCPYWEHRETLNPQLQDTMPDYSGLIGRTFRYTDAQANVPPAEVKTSETITL